MNCSLSLFSLGGGLSLRHLAPRPLILPGRGIGEASLGPAGESRESRSSSSSISSRSSSETSGGSSADPRAAHVIQGLWDHMLYCVWISQLSVNHYFSNDFPYVGSILLLYIYTSIFSDFSLGGGCYNISCNVFYTSQSQSLHGFLNSFLSNQTSRGWCQFHGYGSSIQCPRASNTMLLCLTTIIGNLSLLPISISEISCIVAKLVIAGDLL